MTSIFGGLQNCRENPYTLSTKSLAKALATFWIDKGLDRNFLDFAKTSLFWIIQNLATTPTFSVCYAEPLAHRLWYAATEL